MQSKLPIAVLCGVLLMTLAACGGSGDGARITELEADLVAEQETREQAEELAADAELKRQEEAAARIEAEAEAETAAAEAADEIEEAKDDAAEAEQQRQEEEDKRQAAEANNQRLAAAAEKRQKADAAERARTAISGDWTVGNTSPGVLGVGAIKYGAAAPVTNPAGPFSTSPGRSGRWSTTSLTAHAEPTRDMIEIYSDVEAPKRSAFSTSPLNTGTDVGGPGDTPPPAVIDGTEKVVGWVNIMNADGDDDGHSRIAAAGAFPRVIGDPEPFKLVDKGHSQGEFDGLNWDDNNNSALDENEEDILETEGVTRQRFLQYIAGNGFRKESDFPERYAYTTSGFLQGADGKYRCDGANADATCTVQNRGGSFEFVGVWAFIPTNGTVQIVVPDAEYMWFGVWARQTVRLGDQTPDQPTEIWAFEARHAGTNRVSDLSAATGSATYQGSAAGRYAVYEPDTGDSGIGSFTASATLRADFDVSPNTVSGMITGFSNDPSWSLALKQGNITGDGKIEAAEDTVTWTIDGVPDDSGTWEAAFYTNLNVPGSTDTTRAITYQPHGIAGTFEAEYDPSGVGARAAVIGGFGAHR